MKKIHILSFVVVFCLFGINIASAHVVVKPNQIGVGAFQTFTMGVPVEKDLPTIALRLEIPAGLQYVSPNVKPGWNITVKKDASSSVTEISWTGGSIPVGQRDDFFFSAKVPSAETTLNWKAYQTYKDGTVVAWDMDPATIKDGKGEPYSMTKVVNDLIATSSNSSKTSGTEKTSFALSLIAVVLSVIAFSTNRNIHKQL